MEFHSVLLTAADSWQSLPGPYPSPKALDIIEIKILSPDQLEALAGEMEELSAATCMKFFIRDAEETSGKVGRAC